MMGTIRVIAKTIFFIFIFKLVKRFDKMLCYQFAMLDCAARKAIF